MKRARSKLKRSAQARRSAPSVVKKAPFIEHIYELRQRLFRVALSVIVFSVAAYFVQQHIVNLLLAPAADQKFAQTTPGGGLDFLFRICLYTGIAISVPVIFHQLLKYVEPLIHRDATSFIRRASVVSWFLAIGGIAFGYFIGLPAALHFLLHQFTNPQIETLISLQSYLSFVLLYLLGAAMLFQLPLFMVVINKVKPLKPGKLLRHERWVILFAAVAGALLSPSPNVMDMALLAVPMVLTYQIGIVLVWFINRRAQRPKKVQQLIEQDEAAREQRLAQFSAARSALNVSISSIRSASSLQPAAAGAANVGSAPMPAAAAPAPSVSHAIRQQPAPRPAVSGRTFTRRQYMGSGRRIQL